MEEIIFTYDVSIEKFRSHINNYRDKDIERFIETLYIYIETLAHQEMNERIHKDKKVDEIFELEMKGIKKFAVVLEKFLKNSGQIIKSI